MEGEVIIGWYVGTIVGPCDFWRKPAWMFLLGLGVCSQLQILEGLIMPLWLEQSQNLSLHLNSLSPVKIAIPSQLVSSDSVSLGADWQEKHHVHSQLKQSLQRTRCFLKRCPTHSLEEAALFQTSGMRFDCMVMVQYSMKGRNLSSFAESCKLIK